MPADLYEPAPPVRHSGDPDQRLFDFHGEDGRRHTFALGRLPLPGWHEAIASALAVRMGPAGGPRTLASARSVWYLVGRFMRFLAQLPAAPATPRQLRVLHLQAWHTIRAAKIGDAYAWGELREIGRLLTTEALHGQVAHETVDYTQRMNGNSWPSPRPGYSDRELRLLISTARSDAAAIRDRIRGSERLLEQLHRDPDALDPDQRQRAEELADMADSGDVPSVGNLVGDGKRRRRQLAGQLFLTIDDLPPLLVLGIALTGRNVETLKELPVEHRVIEGRAVEVGTIKRRRGPRHWHETVTWEIGPPGRELHTPGGFYLLLVELTRRSRSFTGSSLLWSIWRHGLSHGLRGADEHRALFDRQLHGLLPTAEWVRQHGLTADPPAPSSADLDNDDDPAALHLSFRRLRTSVEIRRTQQLGGHLPSAARSNTVPVLFRNYLRGDPGVVEWAHEVVSQALVDAEQAALSAHRRTLESSGSALRIVPADSDGLRDQVDDTGWTACADHAHHPVTGRACKASFLDCFHCGNCVITNDHLPRLLGLLDALAKRRQQISEQEWWIRYGMAWAAIRGDILTKFGPAEVEHAATNKTTDELLDLVEAPWEVP